MKKTTVVLAGLFLAWAVSFGQSQQAGTQIPGKEFDVIKMSPSQLTPEANKAFQDLSAKLESKGFKVMLQYQSPKKLSVDFIKLGQSDAKGLLGVKWTKKLEGNAQFYLTDGSWVYLGGELRAWEKPPIIGDWALAPVDTETAGQVNAVFAGFPEVPKGGQSASKP
jgi:hypothetical protein